MRYNDIPWPIFPLQLDTEFTHQKGSLANLVKTKRTNSVWFRRSAFQPAREDSNCRLSRNCAVCRACWAESQRLLHMLHTIQSASMGQVWWDCNTFSTQSTVKIPHNQCLGVSLVLGSKGLRWWKAHDAFRMTTFEVVFCSETRWRIPYLLVNTWATKLHEFVVGSSISSRNWRLCSTCR